VTPIAFLTVKEFAHKRFVDDGDFQRSGGVVVVEIAPTEKWRAQGVEVTGSDAVEPRHRFAIVGASMKTVSFKLFPLIGTMPTSAAESMPEAHEYDLIIRA